MERDEELKRLLANKDETQANLNQLEKQLYNLETAYLQKTKGIVRPNKSHYF